MLCTRLNPLKWSTNNRPTPRVVQALVIVAIAGPAVVVGLAAAAVAEVLTVNWPTREAS